VSVRPVPLIDGPRAGLPPLRAALLDELRRLKERRGEMIAAVDDDTGEVVGTIGLYPDRDDGGKFSHLAGIDAAPGYAADVETFLLEEAGTWLRARRMTRLKFGTSPLLTRNAWLYITRFGSRYRWREGARAPDGRPWPYVSCECDFDDPLAHPLDLREDQVPQHSVLDWKDGRPALRDGLVYSGPLSIMLPDLDSDSLADAGRRDPGFIATLYSAFHELHLHGYGFAWFDRLAAPADGPWYYVMKKVVTF
jgi:hypothetical protein